jgi:hypothetical protein
LTFVLRNQADQFRLAISPAQDLATPALADVLPGMTTALWAPGNYRPTMTDTSAAVAGLRPVFSIEVITDQG